MQLETSNLLLEPLTLDDWSLFYSLHKDESVIRFISDPLKDDDIKKRFNERVIPWGIKSESWLCLKLIEKSTGNKVGITGFFSQNKPLKDAELGFMLLPSYQGNGYGFESTMEILRFAFESCNFHKVSATVTDGNIASFNLLQKVGFKLESALKNNFLLNGEWKDDLKLGMLKQEFKSI